LAGFTKARQRAAVEPLVQRRLDLARRRAPMRRPASRARDHAGVVDNKAASPGAQQLRNVAHAAIVETAASRPAAPPGGGRHRAATTGRSAMRSGADLKSNKSVRMP